MCKVYFSAGSQQLVRCLLIDRGFGSPKKAALEAATDVTLHSHHTERWLVPLLMILALLIIAVVLIQIWF